jgi:hypothetical protein
MYMQHGPMAQWLSRWTSTPTTCVRILSSWVFEMRLFSTLVIMRLPLELWSRKNHLCMCTLRLGAGNNDSGK